MSTKTVESRRRFFRYLAASAVLAPAARALAQQLAAGPIEAVIAEAKDALQVMDFEPLAHSATPPAHWGYLSSGVDDDATLRANVEGFGRIGLRPRRLVDVSKPDLSTEVLGEQWDSPLFLCPVGGQRSYNAEGELATARAAKSRRHAMILSNMTTVAVEDVARTLGAAPWQQLYLPQKWADTERLVRRIEGAGCKVLVWTVDQFAGRNSPTMTRFARLDTRQCSACHSVGPAVRGPATGRPMFEGMEIRVNPSDATWATFDRLKSLTSLKLVLKGLETAEDATIAIQRGADGIIVSNHGGRAAETLRGTVDCLPEVVQAVAGRAPVFLDGGVRRGADVYKALALGAQGVGIGRPYIWGLAAFGEEGVKRVLELLNTELRMVMQQMGTPTIREINAARLTRV